MIQYTAMKMAANDDTAICLGPCWGESRAEAMEDAKMRYGRQVEWIE